MNSFHGLLRYVVLGAALLALPAQSASSDPTRLTPAERTALFAMAGQGDVLSQYNLGLMYYQGNGVPKDFVEAAKWFGYAAEQGDASAQYSLGLMYYRGAGGPKDPAEAAKWYRKAAEQGNAAAQFNLGVMYAKGDGVSTNTVEGLAWTNLAAASGWKPAVEYRSELERRVGPQATLTAQQRSKEILREIEAKKRR